jgi:cytochrome P450
LFGWGRRICYGAGLAENSLFIALAKLLWAFDVGPKSSSVYDILAYTEGFNICQRKCEDGGSIDGCFKKS